MKVIDGKNAVMGRLASYVAKEALKGEEIAIVNCEQVIITGNQVDIKDNFERKRGRVGSGQKGPKHSRDSQMIVKRAIRGMMPNHRFGRGKVAFGRIKCYVGIPPEFEKEKKIVGGKEVRSRSIQVGELRKIK
ncbi:MAG: 50S ribosomal protein L13 [Nanoarchaeota archaeon]|nr:50S ribosomal protein L13 [Nanoarchaeota archaeon]MBU1501433.1 50S ribosomal protein L13 [Nanoarchaeota archaeon]MBU2459088.1 50S ribosomal protein L13 [Nanoarchaeota archaeon]